KIHFLKFNLDINKTQLIMKKAILFIIPLCLIYFQNYAQVNHSLTATASHSGGGAGVYGPSNYNDGVIPTAGNLPWRWVSTNGSIEFTQTNAVAINTLVLQKDGRPMGSADIQYWDGTRYVTFYSYSSTVTPKDSITFPTIFTTRLRLDNVAGSSN